MTNNKTDNDKLVGKDRYESLLTITSAQTGKNMPVIIRKSAIALIFCGKKNNNMENFDAAVNMAIEKGDMIVRMNLEGDVECALTLSGSRKIRHIYPYDERNLERLKEIRDKEKNSNTPNEDIIQWANQHISYVEQE